MKSLRILTATCLAAGVLGGCWPPLAPPRIASGGRPQLATNEQFLQGLGTQVDVSDPLAVFRHVAAGLPRKIRVHPSENYYYVLFELAGRSFRGSLNFYRDTVDQGRFDFAYEEIAAVGPPWYRPIEGFVELGPGGPVSLERRGEREYLLRVDAVRIGVELVSEGGFPAPVDILREDEVYVGTSSDESGTRFHLVYSRGCRQFLWLLDERAGAPEPMADLDASIAAGARTGFMYLQQQEPRRRVLIGVSALEERRNSWYDGPFDQLPDNDIFAGRVELGRWLLDSRPWLRGEIDRFGNLLADRTQRIAIAPYVSYLSRGEVVRRVRDLRSGEDPRWICRLVGRPAPR